MRYIVVAAFFSTWFLTAPGADVPPLPKDTLPKSIDLKHIPVGLEPRNVPPDNPLSAPAVELGRKLFFDPLLSADRTVACATCHRPDHGFASPQPRAIGILGKVGRRNAPSLLNRAFAETLFWDGRLDNLEVQALKPIEDPNEMGSTLEEVVARLRKDAQYPKLFAAVYPDGVTSANIGKALASFERTLLLGDSGIDRFRATDVDKLSTSERQGLWLFESKGKCWRCHSGHNFTDELFHNTGVSWGSDPLDLGRYEITGKESDKGKFKTPTLRGVALTAPYMHDGSIKTLEEVVEFYSKGGKANPSLDPSIEPLNLTKDEIVDLVAFLKALSKTTQP